MHLRSAILFSILSACVSAISRMTQIIRLIFCIYQYNFLNTMRWEILLACVGLSNIKPHKPFCLWGVTLFNRVLKVSYYLKRVLILALFL